MDLDVTTLEYLAALAKTLQEFDEKYPAANYDLYIMEVEVKHSMDYVLGSVKFDDFDRWVFSPKAQDD